MNNNKTNENKLGTMPIPKLLLTMAVPAIFSMLVLSLYNVVDSMFIAKVSDSALDAVTFAFPMQTIMLAFAVGLGVGANSIIARKLGEGNKEGANAIAKMGLLIAAVLASVFMILGTFFPSIFLSFFTSDAEIIKMGGQYLMVCMLGCFGMFIEILIAKSIQATGNMIVPMISQLIGAVTNIILDPIFIFVFDMGVVGAGLATIIGQISAMTFMIIVASKRRHVIDFFSKKSKLQGKNLGEIVKMGLPVMVMNSVAAIVVIFMNIILVQYHEKAPAALGIYFKLQSFIFMPVFGLMQGTLPILSFNYGANNISRYKKTFTLSLLVSLAVMFVGLIVFQFGTEFLMGMFSNKSSPEQIVEYEKLLEVGKVCLQMISWSFLPAAFNIVATTGFQSIGKSFISLLMSLLRQLLILIPVSMLLGYLFGLKWLWFSFAVAELVALAVFTPYYFYAYNKAFKRRLTQSSQIDTEESIVDVEVSLPEGFELGAIASDIVENDHDSMTK